MSPRPPFPGRALLFYLAGLAWAAALLWRVDGFLRATEEDRWARDSRRLLVHAAEGIGARWADLPGVAARVRRLAGEPETRFARLTDAAGRSLASFGDVPAEEALPGFSRAGEGRSPWRDGAPGTAFRVPVLSEGRRVGFLTWGLWSTAAASPAPARRALAAAFLWWAAAGGLLFLAPWTRRRLGDR